MAVTVNRGQSIVFDLEFFQEDEDGPVLNLTGGTVQIAEKNFYGDPVCAIVSAVGGTATVTLSTDVTLHMSTKTTQWFKVSAIVGPTTYVFPKVEMTVS